MKSSNTKVNKILHIHYKYIVGLTLLHIKHSPLLKVLNIHNCITHLCSTISVLPYISQHSFVCRHSHSTFNLYLSPLKA